MSAYLIGHITVRDPERWAAYRSAVPETLAAHGGTIVFRGTRRAVLAGQHPYNDVVVIHFPDAEGLEAWFHSDAYQALIPLRDQAADVVLVSYDA